MYKAKTCLKYFIASSKTEIIFIRHAQSVFNQACHTEISRLNIEHLPWSEQVKNEELCRNVCYNEKYLDCPITSKGRNQSEGVADSIQKQLPIDLVLVSPYLRALQTCSYAFSRVNVPVVVDPLLAESCRFSCDILTENGLHQKKRKFPQFSFHLVKEQNLAYAVSPEKYKTSQEKLRLLNESELMPQVMSMLQSQHLYETNKDLRERAWQIKLKLAQLGKKYKRICVVSHWYTLTYILSTKFADCGANLQYQDVENCIPYKYLLEDLLKIK